MWIFLPWGFFSVTWRDDLDCLQVRARHLRDLQKLVDAYPEMGTIETDAAADYRWRVYCSRNQWATVVADAAHDIDYPNFKRRALDFNPARRWALFDVWRTMQRVQTEVERALILPQQDD